MFPPGRGMLRIPIYTPPSTHLFIFYDVLRNGSIKGYHPVFGAELNLGIPGSLVSCVGKNGMVLVAAGTHSLLPCPVLSWRLKECYRLDF